MYMLVVSTPEPKKLACPTITNIQLINEKPLVIQEYKSGKDIPNQQIITKLERVLGVKLRDEVYAQVSSAPKSEKVEEKLQEVETTGDGGEEEIDGLSKSSTPHMFCKTLTSSNTSTHGGFSVPRRAAEDCFPPLDYRQQRPSQELIPKDLHGKEWRFRHIYRVVWLEKSSDGIYLSISVKALLITGIDD